jgi:alanine dehydrogenase
MRVGIPKEIKNNENRIAIVPAGVHELVAAGHEVFIEKGGGLGSGISDAEFKEAGARILPAARAVWAKSEMIIKVKEPLPSEYKLIRPGQVLFTYFHFAASRELTAAMIRSGATCIAYETLTTADGKLPLLTPMSEVAGRMAIQEGAKYLEKPMMGRGILLGGVPGVEAANVVILGGGVVGSNAAKVAAGLGANVFILDVSLDRLRYLDDIMPANVSTLMSNFVNIRETVKIADLLIGAVLLPGGRAPVLVPKSYLKTMKNGAVIVDVAVDQGGCVESCRPTTHSDPTFVVDGVVHYCVANMPGAVGRTSTYALTNATQPWAVLIANLGAEEAIRTRREVAAGTNVVAGQVTHQVVADTFKMKYVPVKDAI